MRATSLLHHSHTRADTWVSHDPRKPQLPLQGRYRAGCFDVYWHLARCRHTSCAKGKHHDVGSMGLPFEVQLLGTLQCLKQQAFPVGVCAGPYCRFTSPSASPCWPGN